MLEHKLPRWLRWTNRIVVTAGAAVVTSSALFATSSLGVLPRSLPTHDATPGMRNVTIRAVDSLSVRHLLSPGEDGDVVVAIENPNGFAVTVTGVLLPASTRYATGYAASSPRAQKPGCSSADSGVVWRYSTATNGSAHTLVIPLVVGANRSVTVTLTEAAQMKSTAPVACEDTYFLLPSLTGVTINDGGASAAESPAIDSWTK